MRIIVALGLLLVVSVAFITCQEEGFFPARPFYSQSSPATPSTTDNDNDNDDDDDDEEDLRDCTDSGACESICQKIYDTSYVDCYDLEVDEVSNLYKVYKELKAGKIDRSDLEDIKKDHFEEYLNIGTDGWLKEIDGTDPDDGYAPASASTVLEWLVEDADAAEVLHEAKDGHKIIENLIHKIVGIKGRCDGGEHACLLGGRGIIFPPPGWRNHQAPLPFSLRIKTVVDHIAIAGKHNSAIDDCFTNRGYVKLHYYSLSSLNRGSLGSLALPVKEIMFDSHLCLYRNLTATKLVNGTDIFTASAKRNNPFLFELAFEILDDVCSNHLDSGTNSKAHKTVCRKAVLCTLAMKEQIEAGPGLVSREDGKDKISKWEGWQTLDSSDVLTSKLGTLYKECTASKDTEDGNDAFDRSNL